MMVLSQSYTSQSQIKLDYMLLRSMKEWLWMIWFVVTFPKRQISPTGGFAESRALERTWCGILPSAAKIRRFGDLSLAWRFSTCWDWELAVGTCNSTLTKPYYGTQWGSDVSILICVSCSKEKWSCSMLWLVSWLPGCPEIAPRSETTYFSFEWPPFSWTELNWWTVLLPELLKSLASSVSLERHHVCSRLLFPVLLVVVFCWWGWWWWWWWWWWCYWSSSWYWCSPSPPFPNSTVFL